MARPAFTREAPEQELLQGGGGCGAHGASLNTRQVRLGRPGACTTGTQQDAVQPEPELHAELTQLRKAMESRPVIDQAKGVLMAAYRLSPEETWKVLVGVSQRTNIKLRTVAQNIVDSTQRGAVDKHLRTGIEAALRDMRAREAKAPETKVRAGV